MVAPNQKININNTGTAVIRFLSARPRPHLIDPDRNGISAKVPHRHHCAILN